MDKRENNNKSEKKMKENLENTFIITFGYNQNKLRSCLNNFKSAKIRLTFNDFDTLGINANKKTSFCKILLSMFTL
jgi:hypothetical protein